MKMMLMIMILRFYQERYMYALGKCQGNFRDQQQKVHDKHSKAFKNQNHNDNTAINTYYIIK